MNPNNVIPINPYLSKDFSEFEISAEKINEEVKCFITGLAYKQPHEIIYDISMLLENIDKQLNFMADKRNYLSEVNILLSKAYIALKALESQLKNKDQPIDLNF